MISTEAVIAAGRAARQSKTPYMTALDSYLDQISGWELFRMLYCTAWFYQGYSDTE